MASVVSCGPLLKKEGIIKTPPSANYLDGDVVTFSCKPKYFIHGDIERRCNNGTWSPGWWCWCRDRNLEYGLKWMTALLSILGFVILFAIIFCCCWAARRRREREYYIKYGVVMNKTGPLPGNVPAQKTYAPITTKHYEDAPPMPEKAQLVNRGPPPAFKESSFESYGQEPGRVGGGRMVTSA
uniref:Sushi domain-containing protein n=1 Tax=Plectus sambesii TaxID=2011161 RepID=A0A914ULV2_9BILA